jgi:hypothetical protein
MTAIRKSTINRYRAADSRKKFYRGPLFLLSVLFLICFSIYQIILSNSNGGKEVVTSAYRSFLKGKPSGSVAIGDGDGGSMMEGKKEEDHPDVRNMMKPEEHIDDIIIQNDPLPDEKKVKFQEDIFRDENGEGGAAVDAVGFEQKYIFDEKHQMFHNYFKGKSGKVVEEMLMAHAYIFHQNATYGGCCGSLSIKMTAHEDLLDALGLKGALRFNCPRDFQAENSRVRRSVIPRDHYMAEDTRIWTPEYVDYLRSLVTYPNKKRSMYTIIVHMLRGNSSPCKEKSRGFHSYLPNLHYQNLIDKYMKPGARVIIYTSAKSFEDLNEFRIRGYEVNVDTSLKETWKEFVTADVMIMSRSDFSMVPAMVAQGTVVYTPFWHHSLRRWKRVSKTIMTQTDEETIRLQETKCVFPVG